MKRQTVLICVIAAVFALLLISYIFIIRPMDVENSKPEETVPPETEEGETLGISDRYFLFTSLQRSDISSIDISNEKSSFTIVSDKNGDLKLKGFETLNLDGDKLATLVSVSTYTLAKTKVGASLTDEKLGEYGLLSPQANWIVTDRDGNRFRVFVGDRLLTGGGYYCMFDGRKSVYVLGNEVADTILAAPEDYVVPVLCAGISQNDFYTVDNFTVFRDGEPFTMINLVDKSEQRNPEALSEVVMTYPTAYYPNTSMYYELIYKFMGFTADGCVKIVATDEDYEKYGLADPAHVILFDYHGNSYHMYFSDLRDGRYYAFSNLNPDVIGFVDAENAEFLEYELIKWIDPYVFQEYINKIDTISVSAADVSAEFRITHIPIEGATDEKNEKISVTANGVGLTEKASENFRQYYKNLLAVAVVDYCKNDEYCPLSEEELNALAKDYSKAYLTFSYKTLTGKTETFRFYRYSTRHSLATIDGVGEFYVPTDQIEKIKNDTLRILSGEEVTAYSKN